MWVGVGSEDEEEELIHLLVGPQVHVEADSLVKGEDVAGGEREGGVLSKEVEGMDGLIYSSPCHSALPQVLYK